MAKILTKEQRKSLGTEIIATSQNIY